MLTIQKLRDMCRDAKLQGQKTLMITVQQDVAEYMASQDCFSQGTAVVFNNDGSAKVRVCVQKLDELLNNPKPQSHYL